MTTPTPKPKPPKAAPTSPVAAGPVFSAPPATAGNPKAGKNLKTAALITVGIVMVNFCTGVCGFASIWFFLLNGFLGLMSLLSTAWAGWEFIQAKRCGNDKGKLKWIITAAAVYVMGVVGFFVELAVALGVIADLGR